MPSGLWDSMFSKVPRHATPHHAPASSLPPPPRRSVKFLLRNMMQSSEAIASRGISLHKGVSVSFVPGDRKRASFYPTSCTVPEGGTQEGGTGSPRKQKGQQEKRNLRGKTKTKNPNPARSINTDCGATWPTALMDDALLMCRTETLAVERVGYLCFRLLSVANRYSGWLVGWMVF